MRQFYIFLDIDGTLFSPAIGRIPESAEAALKQARKNGSKIFLCTGRALAGCSKYLQMDVDGFVFAAGAVVYADHQRIFDHPLNKEEELMIKQLIHEEGMGYSAEGQAGGYCDAFAYDVLMRYFGGIDTEADIQRKRVSDNCFYPEYYEDPDEKIYKVCAYTRHGGSFSGLREKLPAGFQLTVTVRDPQFDDCAEVTNSQITKATGIERILRHYGADREQAVGIGDSENDIPMIRFCGTGIAMGNAMQAVKDQADLVTTGILEDGIAHAFETIGVI